MNPFRRNTTAKCVMFMVSYDDARTASMVVDNHSKGDDDRIVVQIARTQQEQGVLPEGTITSIRRVL